MQAVWRFSSSGSSVTDSSVPSGVNAPFGRTELLVGEEGVRALAKAHVTVFGLGGVGSYAVEALARAGVGRLTLVDFDVIEASNLNRQLVALHSTLGRSKVDVAAERIRDINPHAQVHTIASFAERETLDALLEDSPDHVVDAIDTVGAKVALLETTFRRGLPVVSCMGAANKLMPTGIQVADIADTCYCPLARAVRLGLRKRGIEGGIRCVYSHEDRGVVRSADTDSAETSRPAKQRIQGSISYVPGIVGLTAAGLVICGLLGAPSA